MHSRNSSRITRSLKIKNSLMIFSSGERNSEFYMKLTSLASENWWII
jgi:hypothetical protein